MSTTYETGHAKNVANFESLISFIKGYGAAYNPSKTAIHLGNMQAQAKKAKDAINNLNALLANHGNAIAGREIAFAPIQKLGSRLLSSLKATDAPIQVIDNLSSINRKLQGRRASVKLTDEEKQTLVAEGKVVNQISASQQSFDSLLDTFDKFVKLLASIPQYSPNETELKVATLEGLYIHLKLQNSTVVSSATSLSNARLERNIVMYHPETGMVVTALDAKNYIKSVFGISSPQFKQVSKLVFKSVK
ncbi:hypothetical protein ACHMWN_04665 [Pedobacter sp. UC225_61]|uniref:hypothetical protein n=1 Tax=Pedobacter sp. UC225_61 TaxID=3374623 RepID=UPI0037883BEB